MNDIIRMPAEWEKHRATWIAWPHAVDDWLGKFETIDWVYAEIVRVLADSEMVEILCKSEDQKVRVMHCLDMHKVNAKKYKLHILPTDRSWLRDTAPTAIRSGQDIKWIKWNFTAWAKYENYLLDQNVPEFIAKLTKKDLIIAEREDTKQPFVLEGGAIETNGAGTLIVTEECLQSDIQCRNPGLDRTGYENLFKKYLGIEKTIWLVGGCEGDDTHGHIDDVARFVSDNQVLLAYEENANEQFHLVSKQNEEILKNSHTASGQKINVTRLPMPKRLYFGDERLPASYANFYIANNVVMVPTFNDQNDRVALNIIAGFFPDHKVIGISSIDLVLGFGTFHCLTQQEPV